MTFHERELKMVNDTKKTVVVNPLYTIKYGTQGYGNVEKKGGMVYPFFIGYNKELYFDDAAHYTNGNRLPKYIKRKVVSARIK